MFCKSKSILATVRQTSDFRDLGRKRSLQLGVEPLHCPIPTPPPANNNAPLTQTQQTGEKAGDPMWWTEKGGWDTLWHRAGFLFPVISPQTRHPGGIAHTHVQDVLQSKGPLTDEDPAADSVSPAPPHSRVADHPGRTDEGTATRSPSLYRRTALSG